MSRRKRKKKKNNRKGGRDQRQGRQKATPPIPTATGPKIMPDEIRPEKEQAPCTAHEGAANQHEGKSPNRPRRFIGFFQWLGKHNAAFDVIFSFCLVLFAVAEVLVGWWQWSAMRTQNDYIAKQTDAMIAQNKMIKQQIAQTDETIKYLRLEHRAWMDIIPNAQELAAGHMACEFEIHNYSGIPVIVESAKITCHAATPPLKIEPFIAVHDAAEPSLTNRSVPPGAGLRLAPSVVFVDEKLINEIASGESLFLVLATVEYTDAGGGTWGIDRSWIYDLRSQNLAVHGEHTRNYECPKQ